MNSTSLINSRRYDELASRLNSEHSEFSFAVLTPTDGKLIGVLPEAASADIRAAAANARTAQRGWAALDPAFRRLCFSRLVTLTQAFEAEITRFVQAETGKSAAEARSEAHLLSRAFRTWSRHAVRALKPAKQRPGLRLEAITHRKPKGLIGISSGTRHPFGEPATHAALALLAGNAVLLRPSPGASFTALLLAELFEAANLPKGLVQVVAGEGTHLDTLVAEAVDHVVFGESPELAWRCAQARVSFTEHAPYVPVVAAATLSPAGFTNLGLDARP